MRLENPIKYPRTYASLKDIRGFYYNNSIIRRVFQSYTQISDTQATQLLQLNTSPHIVLVPNLTTEKGRTSYGIFDESKGPNMIRIRKNVVEGLEMAKLEETIYATAFFLSVTILHEFVHYYRYRKKLDTHYEYGDGFERDAFGFGVELDNIGNRYLSFKKYFQYLKNEIHKK